MSGLSGDMMMYVGIAMAAIGVVGLILTIIISSIAKGKVIDRINNAYKEKG